MKDIKLILATDENGNDITSGQVETWLRNSTKKELADFFYHRFYGRYLKPFNFENNEYITKYKNGFAIMSNCCLLIETFVSFTVPIFKDTTHKCERCFGYFFLTNPGFLEFSQNGLTKEQYLNVNVPIKNVGIPLDFYRNLRNGVLHNGETRNGWKINRKGELFDKKEKRINAVRFMNELIYVIENFKKSLINSNFNTDQIWLTYRDRLKELIDKS